MTEQERREIFARYVQGIPGLAKDVQAYGKTVDQVKSIRCKYETVERQPNYLAAIHGDEEEARFIASNKVELLHTGYIFVSVTFDDESVLLRTYFNQEVAAAT